MTCESNKLNQYKIEFMHELSHRLSAKDHYCYFVHCGYKPCVNPNCYECYGNPYNPPNCLMNELSSFSDVGYCNTCISMINSYINAIR